MGLGRDVLPSDGSWVTNWGRIGLGSGFLTPRCCMVLLQVLWICSLCFICLSGEEGEEMPQDANLSVLGVVRSLGEQLHPRCLRLGGMSSHLRVWSLWQCRCCLCSSSSCDSGFVFWDTLAEDGGSVSLGFPPSLPPVLIPLLLAWLGGFRRGCFPPDSPDQGQLQV